VGEREGYIFKASASNAKKYIPLMDIKLKLNQNQMFVIFTKLKEIVRLISLIKHLKKSNLLFIKNLKKRECALYLTLTIISINE
jgi:hypothetical protein